MKKLFVTLMTVLMVIGVCPESLSAQKKKKAAVEPKVEFKLPSDETDAEKAARMQWWTDARFGMFIHWGLYALPARHEWVRNRERITNEQYEK